MKEIKIAVVGAGLTGLYVVKKLLSSEFRVKFPFCSYKIYLYEYREEMTRNQILLNAFDTYYVDLLDFNIDDAVNFVKNYIKRNSHDKDINYLSINNESNIICTIKDLQNFMLDQFRKHPKCIIINKKITNLDELNEYDLVFASDGANSTISNLMNNNKLNTNLSYSIVFTWKSDAKQSTFNDMNDHRFRYFNINNHHYGAIQLKSAEVIYNQDFKSVMNKYSKEVSDFCENYDINITNLEDGKFDIVPIIYSESDDILKYINHYIPCIFVGESLMTCHFFSGSAIPIYKKIIEKIFNIFYNKNSGGDFLPVLKYIVDRKPYETFNKILEENQHYYKMKSYTKI